MELITTNDYQFLKTGMEDRIAVVAISAPKSLNALNSVIIDELTHYVSHLDEEVRVLIITGDGEKSFVAGADISEMATLDYLGGCAFGKAGAELFRMIETLPIPVIAAVNGFALGGGCELAMACDIRLASNRAKFGQPEVGLGIIPGFSGTVRLARLVGMGYAKELIFSGRPVKAEEALRIGLVNAIYEPEALMDAAVELARKIAANAPVAVRYAKTCINQEWDMPADTAIEFETEHFGRCFDTEDQKEGMRAFLNKEKAEFKGL